ncbi:MAG: diguanylate cyclase [bacterium]
MSRIDLCLVERCARGERSAKIDLSDLLRLGLAACAGGFLVVASLVPVWKTGLDRRAWRLHHAAAIPLVALLIALAMILALRPAALVGGFPLGQVILLAAAGTLLALAVSVRKQRTARAAPLPDSAALDTLTGVASHRAFQDRLAHECERAYRFGNNFMLLMLDLDDFHPLNNRYGHDTGDRILFELARRLAAQLREIDMVARFGGDQFAMILPHTYEKGGLEVAERLRQNVAGWAFSTTAGVELRLTASLGLCSYPQDGASAPELVEAVQGALDFAKAMGGNQFRLSRDLPSRESPGNVVPLSHTGRGAIVRSLAAAVDLRDGYTHEHSQLVSELSASIARRMGLPAREVACVGEGAYLHDVGKIGVPDAILAKTGSLSTDEWTRIREHPVLAKQIIEQAPELMDVMPLVLHHQEHYDGSGYPGSLCGVDIPLGARIIGAADAYHAIRSDRPYRSGRTHQEAVRELRRCSGGQFDPEVVETLLEILESDAELRAMLPREAVGAYPVVPRAGSSVAAPTETATATAPLWGRKPANHRRAPRRAAVPSLPEGSCADDVVQEHPGKDRHHEHGRF